jgi:hypothetical protein
MSNKKAKPGVTVWDFYIKKKLSSVENGASGEITPKKKQSEKKRTLLHGVQSNQEPKKKFKITKLFNSLDEKEAIDKKTKKRITGTAISLIRTLLFTDDKEKAGIFSHRLINIATGKQVKPLVAKIVKTKFSLTDDGKVKTSFRIDETTARFTLVSRGKSKVSFKNNLEKFVGYFNNNSQIDLLKKDKVRKWLKIQ